MKRYPLYTLTITIIASLLVVTTGAIAQASGYVIVETVNDYSQNPNNLANLNYANAFGDNIKNTLRDHGVVVTHFVDSVAWESDFEHKDGSRAYIDYYDMAIFSGHGGADVFYFGTNKDKDNDKKYQVDAIETYWYGRIKWTVLHACKVLYKHSYTLNQWKKYAFGAKGTEYTDLSNVELHGIYGYKTDAYDEWRVLWWYDNQGNTGKTFAEKLVAGMSIKDAWFTAIAAHEQPGWPLNPAKGAILLLKITVKYTNGEETVYYYIDDHLPGFGTVLPDPKTIYNSNDYTEIHIEWVYIEQ